LLIDWLIHKVLVNWLSYVMQTSTAARRLKHMSPSPARRPISISMSYPGLDTGDHSACVQMLLQAKVKISEKPVKCLVKTRYYIHSSSLLTYTNSTWNIWKKVPKPKLNWWQQFYNNIIKKGRGEADRNL